MAWQKHELFKKKRAISVFFSLLAEETRVYGTGAVTIPTFNFCSGTSSLFVNRASLFHMFSAKFNAGKHMQPYAIEQFLIGVR